MEQVRRISFIGSLPPIQSAIQISGQGDGARLRLEIPQFHADVIPLVQMFFTGVAFRITFDLDLEDSSEEQDTAP